MKAIEYIKPANIVNAVQGTIKYHKWANSVSKLPLFQAEQYVYRAYICRSCVSKGKCHGCSCSFPALFFAPNKKDADDKWPKYFKTPLEWVAFKNSSNEYKQWEQILTEKEMTISDPNIYDFISTIFSNEQDTAEKSEDRLSGNGLRDDSGQPVGN